jgi:hypothetical protein
LAGVPVDPQYQHRLPARPTAPSIRTRRAHALVDTSHALFLLSTNSRNFYILPPPPLSNPPSAHFSFSLHERTTVACCGVTAPLRTTRSQEGRKRGVPCRQQRRRRRLKHAAPRRPHVNMSLVVRDGGGGGAWVVFDGGNVPLDVGVVDALRRPRHFRQEKHRSTTGNMSAVPSPGICGRRGLWARRARKGV